MTAAAQGKAVPLCLTPDQVQVEVLAAAGVLAEQPGLELDEPDHLHGGKGAAF